MTSFVVSSQCTVWIFLTCLIPKFSVSLGNLSNHDDDSNKNATNLHIWQWETVFIARFARACFISWHFEDVLVLSTTWNDLFCSWVDDVSLSWQMLNFVFLRPKRLLQFNPRIVRTDFSSIMTLSNWIMITEPQSYIFRWRSRFRRRRVCLSSLLLHLHGNNLWQEPICRLLPLIRFLFMVSRLVVSLG